MKSFLKTIGLAFSLLFVQTRCSEEGQKYSVQITSISKLATGSYCTYNFTPSTNGACVPGTFFIDVCDKYKVGDVVAIEIAKGSQTKTCP